jgi:deoxyribonuclease V
VDRAAVSVAPSDHAHAILLTMLGTESWPASAKELRLVQQALAAAHPPAWHGPAQVYATGGCFVCFTRGASGRGWLGEPGWAGSALAAGPRILASAVVRGVAGDS